MVAAGLLAKKAVEKGLDREAMGQDISRARFESGSRLSNRRGLDAVPGSAEVQPGGLWLHHLHRQQWSACRITWPQQ